MGLEPTVFTLIDRHQNLRVLLVQWLACMPLSLCCEFRSHSLCTLTLMKGALLVLAADRDKVSIHKTNQYYLNQSEANVS